ncbi:myotubularin-related protein 4-like isoform X1 [Lytechinus pictus]|uniref:myotubularin-related protein 4-like isoform X1 n=1 Tax=Lytechinus pictus TaxID=7653 RepID=UPI0030B9B730
MAEPLEELDSLVHVNPSEAFPKRPLHKDNPALECPFPELCGESIEFIGEASDGAVIVLSNYRLHICYAKSFVNVPVGLIENAECKDQECLVVTCKDGKLIRCQFDTSDQCQEWLYRVLKTLERPSKLDDIFAFSFHAWCFDHLHRESDGMEPGVCFLEGSSKVVHCKFRNEIDRQGFDLKRAWRIFDNSDFKYCTTYPTQHIVPKEIEDDTMKKSANFRTSKRFPSVVWRHKGNGAVIARCSQPAVGWFGWRSEEDEGIMSAILDACAMDDPKKNKKSCHSNGHVRSESKGIPNDQDDTRRGEYDRQSKTILIIDARSYAAAFANRAKGGGCEYPEYYTCCDIEFMGLANIHTIRKSFNTVHALCSNNNLDQSTWLSNLEATKWLQNLSMLLKSSIKVVTAIDQDARPVIVHCSDGWDRTPQIVALAEIMLDPFYRTMQGFQVLVEREWLDFGHKFADRCGHRPGQDDGNERCPVFLQWLDCIHQLLRQYPTAFEFNETFLVKLVQHTYSCLFGTFLCNSLKARLKNSVKERTCSVWSLLIVEGNKYKNFLYDSKIDKVLYPTCDIRELDLWIAVYLSETSHSICEDSGPPVQQASQSGLNPAESPKLSRTRSFDNIHKSVSEDEPSRGNMGGDTQGLTRTSSDPNLSDLKIESTLGTSPKNRIIPPLPLEREDEEAKDTQDEPLTNGHTQEDGSDNEEGERGLTNGHGVEENGDSAVTLTNGVIGTPEDCEQQEINGNGHDIRLSNGLTNGHTEEDFEGEISEGSPLSSTPRKTPRTKHILDAHMESSTETVTEDSSPEHKRTDDPKVQMGPTDCNGFDHSPVESNGDITPNGDILNGHAALMKGLLFQSSSISTSTSDISNSHVGYQVKQSASVPIQTGHHIPHLPLLDDGDITPLANHLSKLSSLGVSLSNGHNNHISQSAVVGSEPSFSTCLSRTSSCSNSNGLEAMVGDALGDSQRQLKLGRHLDLDGLTCIKDPRQRRMLGILQEQQQKMEVMKQREQILLTIIERLRVANEECSPNLACALDELENCNLLNPEDEENRSHSRCNSIRSDVSWEQIDEGDTSRTLWIPDHAVSHCSLCNSRFNLVVRKHHCRNCGQIFCASCSNFFIAIPREQLYQPQRVCQPCHQRLEVDALHRHEHALEGSRQMGTVRDG